MRRTLSTSIAVVLAVAVTWLFVMFSMARSAAYQNFGQAQAAFGSAFTYQGQLTKSGAPVNDTCAFQFSLWDAAAGGTQIGSTETMTTTITNGLFSLALNSSGLFGAEAFNGDSRYLAAAVKCSGDSSFDKLGGRTALNAVPYAQYAARSAWSGLSGIPPELEDGDDSVPSGTLIMTESPAPPLGYTSTGRTMAHVEQGLVGQIPNGRTASALAAIGGKVYAVGGEVAGTAKDTVESYDVASQAWTAVASMSTPRRLASAATVNGKIYVFGGYADDVASPLDIVESYDPVTDSWTTHAAMPTPRLWMSAMAAAGKVYVGGGYSGTPSPVTVLTSIDVYDPVADSWSTLKAAPVTWTNVWPPYLAVADGKLFVLGTGSDNAMHLVAYDPATDSWTELPAPPLEFFENSSVAAIGERVYVFGVAGRVSDSSAVQVYTPSQQEWSLAPNLGISTKFFATESNGVLYGVLGSQLGPAFYSYGEPTTFYIHRKN